MKVLTEVFAHMRGSASLADKLPSDGTPIIVALRDDLVGDVMKQIYDRKSPTVRVLMRRRKGSYSILAFDLANTDAQVDEEIPVSVESEWGMLVEYTCTLENGTSFSLEAISSALTGMLLSV